MQSALAVAPQATMPAGGAAMRQTAPAIDQGKDEDYYDTTRLRRQYQDFAAAKTAEATEMVEARHYYHGDQWTKEEIAKLRERKQPVVTSNRIVRKIDAVVGLVERLRQDPKAFARTPKHDEGAELATATLRFVLDNNDWKSKSSRIARAAGIDGIAGIEYDLVPGDEGDPSLEMHIAYGDGYFYDPRSFDEGFTDARFLGVAKWVDAEQAKEIAPDKADEIADLMESGTDLVTINETDREKNWVNTNEKKLRLVDHWYIKGGKWRWCLYVGNTVLMQGVSPFIDEKGKTFPRYRMFSASVDHDGDRYGFVRNLKSPQDEINHRRSKSLWRLAARGLVVEKGALDDIEVGRREVARPDMLLETNPGLKVEFDDNAKFANLKGELELLQEAKNEIENFGPNPALIGQGLEDSSGRAIQLLQQAGIAELGPYLSAFKNWKIRVYRDIWNIIQRYWSESRWIRVTDDQNLPQYFEINKSKDENGQPILDQYGRPALVNAIGSLDVDIIIDEGPDAVNMQGDSMLTLQALGPQFAQEFPEIALELSSLPNSVKKPMLDKIKAKQSAPPPPDPRVKALQDKAQIDGQQAQQDMALKVRQQQLDEQAAQREEARRERESQQELMLQRMQAIFDQSLQRQQAANEIHVERMKAAAQLQAQREAHDQDMELERDRAAYERQLAKSQPAEATA